MSAEPAIRLLNQFFLRDYPAEAAREIEHLPTDQVLPALVEQPATILSNLWTYLLPDVAERLLLALPGATTAALLDALDPIRSAKLIDRMTDENREYCLGLLRPALAKDIRQLLEYPADSAGRLMDARITVLRGSMTATQALDHLRRASQPGRIRFIFLVDNESHPTATVDLQKLVLAEPDTTLDTIARPLATALSAMEPRSEIVKQLEQYRLEELPVLDVEGKLLGVIRSEVLRQTVQEDTSADLQAMVGVSREERALSPAIYSARKRILWMHVNLATAFLAASVVGAFESTISQFTALAVLMPVVAGMGGNMGSQALAVTLRGLALREITARHWLKVFFKEIQVGILNGTLIALTTALAVFFWSQNSGLALVIGLAMSISLSIACVAGAMVPIILTRVGQDPAQSSAIFLTTVTDITGFMSFLGIATLLSSLLLAGG